MDFRLDPNGRRANKGVFQEAAPKIPRGISSVLFLAQHNWIQYAEDQQQNYEEYSAGSVENPVEFLVRTMSGLSDARDCSSFESSLTLGFGCEAVLGGAYCESLPCNPHVKMHNANPRNATIPKRLYRRLFPRDCTITRPELGYSQGVGIRFLLVAVPRKDHR